MLLPRHDMQLRTYHSSTIQRDMSSFPTDMASYFFTQVDFGNDAETSQRQAQNLRHQLATQAVRIQQLEAQLQSVGE
jgi:hypothetical protein